MNIRRISIITVFVLLFMSVKGQSNSFSENFEQTSNSRPLPSGWDGVSDYEAGVAGKNNSYLWKSTALTRTTNHENVAGRCAALSANHANTIKARLKSPAITLSGTKYAKLKFKLRNATQSGSSGDFSVYVSTDGGTTYQNNPIVQHISTGNEWQDYEYSLESFLGQQIVLVFEGASSGSSLIYYYFLDNVEITDAPSCQTPTTLMISSLTDNAASVSWSLDPNYGSVPSTYSIQLKNNSGTLLVDTIGYANAYLSYDFTNLTENTTYTARIMSDCSTSHRGTSEWQEIQFTTPPAPKTLPMIFEFDTLNSLPAGSTSKNVSLFSATASTKNLVYGGYGKSLRLSSSSADISYIVLPPSNVTADSMEVDLKIKCYNGNSVTSTAKYKIGYVTDVSDIQSYFVPIISDSIENGTDWKSVFFNMANSGDGTTPVSLCIFVDAGFANSIYVDNIDIHYLPQCRRPEGFTAYNPTSSSITLNWLYASSSMVEVRAEALDGSLVTDTATTVPFVLAGLSANTNYSISARTVCGLNDTSRWTPAIDIRTQCQAISAALNEDFESVNTNETPDCWRMGWLSKPSSITVPTPFSPTSQSAHSGQKSMSFVTMKSGAVAYLSSPLISFNQSGSHDVSIWIYRKNIQSHVNERIEIWATPLENSTVGGTLLGTCHSHYSYGAAEPTIGWYNYQYNIAVQGNYHITLVCHGEGASMEFDDVEIVPAPACRDVKRLTQGRVGANEVELKWTNSSITASQWMVDYKVYVNGTEDTLPVQDTSVVIAVPSIAIDHLLPSTDYRIWAMVRTICSASDTAVGMEIDIPHVHTRCELLNSLPYMTGFETYDQEGDGANPLPQCWSRLSDGLSENYYPYNFLSSQMAQNGNQSLYFNSQVQTSTSTTPTYQIAVMPGIDTTHYQMNQLKIKFSAKCVNNGSANVPQLQVGVMSDPEDETTFTMVDNVLISSATYADYTILLSAYAGIGVYPAFKLLSGGSQQTLIVDDVRIELDNNCNDISGDISISNVKSSSAVITIIDPTVERWQVSCCTEGQMADAGLLTTVNGVTVVTLAELVPETYYTVYVRRVCGSEYSSWSVGESFRTKCAAISVYPYFEDFETQEIGLLGDCYEVTSSSTAELKVMQQTPTAVMGEVYNHTPGGARGLMCSDPSSPGLYYPSSGSFVISKIFHLKPGKQYSISFWAKQFEYYSNYTWKCSVKYGTSLMNLSNIETFYIPNKKYEQFKTLFDVDVEDDYYIAFVTNPGDNNTQYYPQIDDIMVDEFSCIGPGNLVVQSLGRDSVSISYSNSDSLWQFALSSDSARIDGNFVTSVYLDTTTYSTITIRGLNPNTTYYCMARNVCQPGDSSRWSEVETFHTKCFSMQVPHSDSFEKDEEMSCWSMQNTVGQSSIFERNNAQKVAGYSSLKVKDCLAISPEYAVDSLNHYFLRGWVYSENDNASMLVQVMTDPDDISTSSDPVATIVMSEKNRWYEFVVYFDDLALPDFEDYKYARYINFLAGTSTIYLDSIVLEPVASCPMPYDAQVYNVTANSFDIMFTEHGTATEWMVNVNGVENLISENPATITGLAPITDYNISIASLCSPTTVSYPFDCGTIRTECGIVSLPWSVSFEHNEGYTNLTYHERALEEKCWLTHGVRSEGDNYPYYYMSTEYAYSGKQSLYLYNSTNVSNDKMCIVLPEMNGQSNNLIWKLQYRNSSESAPVLEMGYMTNAIDENSFVPFVSLPAVTQWTAAEINTSTVQGMPARAHLAMRLVRNASSGAIFVDDITVKRILSCSDTEQPVVLSLTETEATVTFSDTCSQHNHWQYCVGTVGVDVATLTPIDIYTDTFVINGLSPATDYYVYVRAVCGAGDASNWSRWSFTTDCAAMNLVAGIPFVDSFEDQLADNPVAGCYSVSDFGNINNCIITYQNPVGYDNVLTGSKCLKVNASQYYLPDGITLFRKFYLEKDKVYRVGVYTHAISNASLVSILVGTDSAAMSVIKQSLIDQHSMVDNSYRPFWEYMGDYFTVDSTGVYFIAIKSYFDGINTGIYLYYDDFTVEEMAGCIPPVASITSTTSTSVTVSVDDTLATSQFQYRVVKDNEEVVPPTIAISPFFTVNGLEPSTAYKIDICRICGDESQSDWKYIDFGTQCASISKFPFTEDFEGRVFPPHCWTITDLDTASWVRYSSASTGYTGSGLASARMTPHAIGDFALLSTPELIFDGDREYRLDFKNYKTTSASNKDEIEVYLSSSATSVDNATLLGVAKVAGAGKSGMNDNSFEIPMGTNGRYHIVFKGKENEATYSTYVYIDDVVVEELPNCMPPNDIEVIGVSSSSITVNVKAKNEHSSVRFTCTAGGDAITSADCNGTYTFTGLTADTEYELSVYGVCDSANVSAALPSIKVKTTTTDCFAPKYLRTVGIINHSHALLTWCNSPMTTSINYQLTSKGAIIRTGTLTGDSLSLDSLAESTTYTFSVSNYCSGDTTQWASITFTTSPYSFTTPFVCGFENAEQNSHWQMRNLSNGPNWFIIGRSSNGIKSGDKALYVTNDGGTYSYSSNSTTGSGVDAEALIEMAAGYYSVEYDWKCKGVVEENGYIRDYGRFFIVPASTTIASARTYEYNNNVLSGVIQTDMHCLVDSNTWVHQNATIEIPESGIYRMVVMFANDAFTASQPPLAIDNISITHIECMPVKNTTVVGLTTNRATVAVRKHEARKAIQYGLACVANADSVSEWHLSDNKFKNDTIAYNELQPNTTYYLFTRHLCDSDSWSTVMCDTIHTPAEVVDLPYICSFEEEETHLGSWMSTNGTSANSFVIGNATSTEGERSLYVSNNGFSNGYAVTGQSASYAYIPLDFKAGNYEIFYDWRCEGEGDKDYARVFLSPMSLVFEDNQIPTGLSDKSLPIGCISLDGGNKLNLSSSWQKSCYSSFTISNDNVYNMIVYWHNDGTDGTQPPFAIDNIHVRKITCPRPEQSFITVSESNPHSVSLLIKGGATSSLRYVVFSNDQYTDTVTSGLLATEDSVITISGLASSTMYYVCMRYLCSDTDSSAVLSYKFRTLCESLTQFPYVEDFEDVDIVNNSRTLDILGEICWLTESSAQTSYYEITMNSSYTYNGSRALLANNGTSNNKFQTFALPVTNSLNGKSLTLYYKNIVPLERNTVEIGYLANADDASSFVVLHTAPYSTEFTMAEVTYTSVPVGSRAAFRTTGYTTSIDNVRLNDIVNAMPVFEVVCYNTGYHNYGFNCPASSLHPGDTTLTRIVQSSVNGIPDSVITVNLRILNEIIVSTNDTICQGEDYVTGYWNLTKPSAGIYFDTYKSANGCDSIVNLTLVVMPTSEIRFDTICQGETYSFYGQNITTSGVYIGYTQNQRGCNDTITLHLFVVDTLLTTTVSICEGDVYQFEGNLYSQTGSYSVVRTGRHGCSVTKILNLTVVPTDTTIDISICHGGSRFVEDTMITTPGSFEVNRVNALGCIITYHINVTMEPLIHDDVYDFVCQDYNYFGNGIYDLPVSNDTIVVINMRTSDVQCDSSVSVHLTLLPTQYSDTTAHISSNGYITWHNETYTKTGDYQVTLSDENGCDSIVTLHLVVDTKMSDVNADNSIEIIPNPLDVGATAYIYCDISDIDKVDILDNRGRVLNSFIPASYPIEINGITTAGVYYVRIVDAFGNVYIEKLMVR